jgi:transcription-repair coupling factor (superfamily II helicase)
MHGRKKSISPYVSPLRPQPPRSRDTVRWGRLYGAADGLALASLASDFDGLVVLVTRDMHDTYRLEMELGFFCTSRPLSVLTLPDPETLPYDVFSPVADIVSQRLATLYQLPQLSKGLLVLPVATLLQRLPPRQYLEAHSFLLDVGQRLDLESMRARFENAGYRCVAQVLEHGELAVRGSILDVFPMGATRPYRIDLLDDEVESIRTFDPETQRSEAKVSSIRLLPAREFPITDESIKRFRTGFRARFELDPQRSIIYRDVSEGLAPGGIEYYLPLFFEKTESLFDYLPPETLLVELDGAEAAAEQFQLDVRNRFEERRLDLDRPPLAPEHLYLNDQEWKARAETYPRVLLHAFECSTGSPSERTAVNFATAGPPSLYLQPRAPQPASALLDFLKRFSGRVLFSAETPGRRQELIETLRALGLRPSPVDGWELFVSTDQRLAITISPLEQGLLLENPAIALIVEAQIYGERAQQRRRRRTTTKDPESIVRDLTELHAGAPVVHEDHGVGRYLGLQGLTVAGTETEFLALEYAGGDKLYVPVSSLHLISRYAGASPENAPLHKLGGEQWQRVKRKAQERIRDVAAELLEIYARREAHPGISFQIDGEEYAAFASSFPFEETPDQEAAIAAVLDDMRDKRPMDRVICGDVGFGKTEVAMRAAFVATQNYAQVAVLVPTTLLAQQHYHNFRDRFADWPVRVESLSRFSARKDQQRTLEDLAEGRIDIIIGTHKLLQPEVKFKRLGLAVIDEEHRFGVRQKERLKALRAHVDLLTMTATPIPRTLSMALSTLRGLSIIATPPAHRHPIKTFVGEWNRHQILEAMLRELKRGGQVYFLHNEVRTIERIARDIAEIIPSARVGTAHGQMRERDLEQVMLDFYHRRRNVLVCSTIIESGIDIPNANTILINRADKLGLAQLYQLRGRVGRSHHRAYAYLIVPPRRAMKPDALKRLEAIESLEELGAGFTLATHDLEIRGAGELLGEQQSGQIQEIGYTLYAELLERAVRALRSGDSLELKQPLDHGPEIDLQLPALIPHEYLPDVHTRLVLYKRIASGRSSAELRELQVEMIDRFGLLPPQTRNLFRIMELKLKAMPMGIRKIEAGPRGARLLFDAEPRIDTARLIQLIQRQPDHYRFDGKDRLRLTRDLPESEARIQTVEELLANLMVEEAA